MPATDFRDIVWILSRDRWYLWIIGRIIMFLLMTADSWRICIAAAVPAAVVPAIITSPAAAAISAR